MAVKRTPPLSEEGAQEVRDEMGRPPADTPERRATFARARKMRRFLAQMSSIETSTEKQGR